MSEPESTVTTKCVDIFLACQEAIAQGALIQRVSRQDKEFHFQNWFEERLKEAKVHYDQKGRNSYPDFTLVHMTNNELTPEFRDNSSAGKSHSFVAYRAKGINGPKVSMRNP